MNWEDNKLIAYHNGQKIQMGYIFESVMRDHEWYAILTYGGFRQTRNPFQQRFDAVTWMVNHCQGVLNGWRKDD